MKKTLEPFFDNFWIPAKNYSEILKDNEFCPIMSEKLQDLCIDYGYDFQWLGDSFELAYHICGLLHLPFWRRLNADTATLYKCAEEYYLKKYKPSEDDTYILRSIIYLILTKHSASVANPETINYILSRLAEKNRKFTKDLKCYSRKDTQKYTFIFKCYPGSPESWRRDNLFHPLLHYCDLDTYDGRKKAVRIYKEIVCSWPLEERDEVCSKIWEYYTCFHSSYWLPFNEQLDDYEKEELLDKTKIALTYLKSLVHIDLHPNQGMEAQQFAIKNTKAGRKPGILFENNADARKEWADKFVEFLKKHHWYSISLNAHKDNKVNMAFAVLYKHWSKSGVVEKSPNGAACYRFLKTDCGLKIDVKERAYVNFIRKLINDLSNDELKKAKWLDMDIKVSELFKTVKQLN